MCYLVPVVVAVQTLEMQHQKERQRKFLTGSFFIPWSRRSPEQARERPWSKGRQGPTVSTFNHRLPTLSLRLINWWWLAGRWLFPTFQTKWHITLKLQMKLFLPPPFRSSFKSMFEIPLGLWQGNIRLHTDNISFISLLKLLTMYVHFSSHLSFYKRPFLLKVRTYSHYLHLSDCIWQLVVHIGCVAFLINANRANRLILCTHHQ